MFLADCTAGDQWRCQDAFCLEAALYCNNDTDCPHGDDERDCGEFSQQTTSPHRLTVAQQATASLDCYLWSDWKIRRQGNKTFATIYCINDTRLSPNTNRSQYVTCVYTRTCRLRILSLVCVANRLPRCRLGTV